MYYEQRRRGVKSKKTFRHVPSAPERILDAPELIDDYYLNLIDWGSTNQVAVALGCVVYLWNADSGDIQQLCQADPNNGDDYVTSVQWGGDGKHIAVGTNDAEVQIWDVSRLKQVRTLRGHNAAPAHRVNGTQLATGSRDNTVMMHDVRIREHRTATLTSHSQEVCGLKWAPSGNQLASGGNDNLLHIWDQNSIGNGTHLHRLDAHQAAVKALAWCPFQSNLLASGGGTRGPLHQVLEHQHRRAAQQHRHPLAGVLPPVEQARARAALVARILSKPAVPVEVPHHDQDGGAYRSQREGAAHGAVPDGTTVVSAAADETLRFWKCFSDADAGKAKKLKDGASDSSVLRRFNFR